MNTEFVVESIDTYYLLFRADAEHETSRRSANLLRTQEMHTILACWNMQPTTAITRNVKKQVT